LAKKSKGKPLFPKKNIATAERMSLNSSAQDEDKAITNHMIKLQLLKHSSTQMVDA
jgi:hypothetical protein